jgi:hypothetical protein
LVERELAGETEVLGENLTRVIFSTTNPIWHDLRPNPNHQGGKLEV